jgi:hypothetical protein
MFHVSRTSTLIKNTCMDGNAFLYRAPAFCQITLHLPTTLFITRSQRVAVENWPPRRMQEVMMKKKKKQQLITI